MSNNRGLFISVVQENVVQALKFFGRRIFNDIDIHYSMKKGSLQNTKILLNFLKIYFCS